MPTGTEVFDWTIPREWNIRDAYIKNDKGERIVDFSKSNLHVMSYSAPVNARMPLGELKKHIYTLPDQPDLIPYRTSYYAENWAFCMSHRQYESLPDATYEVVIDSSLTDGHLTYGEYFHKGETDDEFLLSAHVCHPSLANDNCSGIALLTHLAQQISRRRTRYSYRFLFAPGTIGAIAWLARNESRVSRIKHGLVVSMVGDGGGPTYKKSRRGNAQIDRAMTHVLRHSGLSPKVLDFYPYGYDERQYCSPGFNLPVGLFQRSQFGTIPQYHTSADNLDFIRPEHLRESYRLIATAIDVIEKDGTYRNTVPKCEPQLGKRGLYGAIGGAPGRGRRQHGDALDTKSLGRNAFAARHRGTCEFAVRHRARDRRGASKARPSATLRRWQDHRFESDSLLLPAKSRASIRSFSEIALTGSGQAMPKAGSSCRTPLAASGV